MICEFVLVFADFLDSDQSRVKPIQLALPSRPLSLVEDAPEEMMDDVTGVELDVALTMPTCSDRSFVSTVQALSVNAAVMIIKRVMLCKVVFMVNFLSLDIGSLLQTSNSNHTAAIDAVKDRS